MKRIDWKKNTALFGMLAALTAGCVEDDSPSVGSNEDANNGALNNGALNNGALNNGALNNGALNNGALNNGALNNGALNNGQVLPEEGAVTIVQPALAKIYTNGIVPIEIARDGDVSDVEVMVNDEVLTTLAAGTDKYEWNTNSTFEGSYDLQMRYALDGAPQLSQGIRTVVVDRTAPTLSNTQPAAGETAVSPSTPIYLEFSEAMDPASITPSSVKIVLSSGSSVDVTATLAEDGKTMVLEFDRSAGIGTYDATITLTGLRDLAGNELSTSYKFTIEPWIADSIDVAFAKAQYLKVGASEYIFGFSHETDGTSTINIYRPNASGDWAQVAKKNLTKIFDMDIAQTKDRVHLGIMREALGSKAVQLLEFNPLRGSLVEGGLQMVGGGADTTGAVALDLWDTGREVQGGIAAATGGELKVYSFVDGDLSLSSYNSFPTADHPYVRNENLSIHIDNTGHKEVIFARCSSAAEPCTRTHLERFRRGVRVWEDYGSSVSTPFVSNVSSTCDEFENFDVEYNSAGPQLLFSYQDACNSNVAQVRTLDGAPATGWTGMMGGANQLAMNASLTEPRYTAKLALDPAGSAYSLLASSKQMQLARIDAGGVTWFPEIAAGWTHGRVSQIFRTPMVAMDPAGEPVVIFNYERKLHVMRPN